MRLALIVPRRPGRTSGNSVTAARWARRLTELGHEVDVVDGGPPPGDADVLVALHARRSAAAVRAWGTDRPVVVALTGTDLYADLPGDPDARASVEAADALVVLQRLAVDRLAGWDTRWADKARVIHQSVDGPIVPRDPDPTHFGVAVLAHLRDVKDPLLAAVAARALPATSRVRVDHAGAAHDARWAARARSEARRNPRYRWHGELDPPESRRLLARCRVLACTSRLEGGANVVTEAIAHGVPVVGTRIDGNVGILGADHPGLVEVGDAAGLAALFGRMERDGGFYRELEARSRELRHLTDPARERRGWADLLATLR